MRSNSSSGNHRLSLELVKAAGEGNQERCQQLLSQGADVNGKDEVNELCRSGLISSLLFCFLPLNIKIEFTFKSFSVLYMNTDRNMLNCTNDL